MITCNIKWSVKHPNQICSDFLLKISFAEHSWESCMIQHNWSKVSDKTDSFFIYIQNNTNKPIVGVCPYSLVHARHAL